MFVSLIVCSPECWQKGGVLENSVGNILCCRDLFDFPLPPAFKFESSNQRAETIVCNFSNDSHTVYEGQ